VARVALLCPDLLFGSKLRSALGEAGHEVVAPGSPADLLVVDLTAEVDQRLAEAATAAVPTLAFYAHVEQDVRHKAEAAGIDRVVPRSRMAHEAPRLVADLLASARG
jgi:dTDP-4-dehydrorhamnose reductase